MIDKQFVINNISNIEKLPNITILKMLMQFKEQLETSGAYHSITIGEVKTLEWEETAYVENVGTSTDLVLNFGIPKGVGFNFSGEWVSDDNEYHPNDVVLYNGNLYICISTILDSEIAPNIDTTHWSLFVGYGNNISNFVKSEYEKSIGNEGKIIHNKEFTDELKKKQDKWFSKVVGLGQIAETTKTLDMTTILNEATITNHGRFHITITGVINAGGTILTLIGVNGIGTQYQSIAVTNLGSHTINASFENNVLTLSGLSRWSAYLLGINEQY